MSTIGELSKNMVSPIEKLITVIKDAVGKVYEPYYIKRMADAKAYEIRIISQALLESKEIPVEYENGRIKMDSKNYDDLIKRAESRSLYQEIRKQANIEAVLLKTLNELENEPPVINDPVDADWINRFFNSVEDISNEQMQLLWSKILAGEIKKPNTFSLRTLNMLKNLTQNEAELFKRISSYILKCSGNKEKSITDYFLPCFFNLRFGDKNQEEWYNISVSDVIKLDEAGIINQNTDLMISIYLESKETDYIFGYQKRIKCYNGSDKPKRLSYPAFLLTESGKQLYSIVVDSCDSLNSDYLTDFLNSFINENALENDISNKYIEIDIE